MQVDLLSQHNQFLVHLDFQVVTTCFNLGFNLEHFFFLVSKKLLALIVCVFLLKSLYSFSLLDLESLELLSVVHGFVDSLVERHELLIVLHNLQLGVGLDLGSLHSTVKFAVKSFHLLLVINLQVLNLLKRFLFVNGETLLPSLVEILHVLLANLNVLSHLCSLDVSPQLVLIAGDFSFKESDFLHEVLVKLILVDLAALFGVQLHFLLDHRKDGNLFVLVKHPIATLVKHFDELVGRVQSQQVVDVLLALVKDQTHIHVVQEALLTEVSLLDSLPDLFALACATDEWSGLCDQLVDFVAGHVSETAESLLA